MRRLAYEPHRSLTILTGKFPARSETFVTAHATGFARRGWQVKVASAMPGADVSSGEFGAMDTLGVHRSYWGAWSLSRAGRVLQFSGEALRDPTVLSLARRNTGWTRQEIFKARRIRRHLASDATGALHVHFGKNAALLDVAGWTGRAVVTWHGFDANAVPRVRGEDVYRSLFSRDWIHTVGSSFMAGRLISLGAPEERVMKVPMGVDFERFPDVDRRGQDEGPLKVISVGRLDEMKGHPILLEGVAEARARGADVTLTILGEGPSRAAITQRIAELGLTEQVRLLGAQTAERVVRELAAADVFALTGVVASSGRVETQGVAYIEAQATGLPVIASDVGGVSESLEAGQTGILTAEGDVSAVADALAAYASNPALRFEHGARGARFVRSRFGLSAMLEAFERLYAEHAA